MRLMSIKRRKIARSRRITDGPVTRYILLCPVVVWILLFGGGASICKREFSAFLLIQAVDATSPSSPSTIKFRLPGNPYHETDDFDDELRNKDDGKLRIAGRGREFNIFESRGGGAGSSGTFPYLNNDEDDYIERYRRIRSNNIRNNHNTSPIFQRQRQQLQNQQHRSSSSQPPKLIQDVQQWYSTTILPRIRELPKIVCRVEPTTTLKLRKTFRPLKTIVRVGADYNTQLGVWQFKSSWEDAIIGGKITLTGKELQLTKSWQLSVGQFEDLVTRLRFRAAINLQTCQAYARVGFRTERLSPINVMEGFTISRRIPLDGKVGGGRNNDGIKLEVKANIALPEPEIEYSTEKSSRTLIGMGNIEVSIDEMNLVLDY